MKAQRRAYLITAGRADGSTREVEVHGWGAANASARAILFEHLEPGETIITIALYHEEKAMSSVIYDEHGHLRSPAEAIKYRRELIEDLRAAWENAEDDGCDAHERAIWAREIRRIERALDIEQTGQLDPILPKE